MSKTSLTLISVCLMSVTTSGSIAADNMLFQSTEALSVVIELPAREILRNADRRPTVPGQLRFTDADGAEVILDVELTTRGNSRLEQCSYPPLKLDLKRSQVVSTTFAGQNKLKLVTQCSGSAASLRYLDQEYIVYRTYNLLSQYSFRVRMLEITFRDSAGRRRDEVHPGFFIESDSEVAARMSMTPIEATIVEIPQLDSGELSIFTLFQYMIGNTDWSVLKGPGTENCCHNGELIGPSGSDTGWVVIPYDFDQSGLINASYALPSDKLPIRSVRQRLYRGFCSGNANLESTIARFNEKRSAIEQLFIDSPIGTKAHKAALDYLEHFFGIVNDPEKLRHELLDHCRGPRT